jgi:beta-glucanase (GH16 family)
MKVLLGAAIGIALLALVGAGVLLANARSLRGQLEALRQEKSTPASQVLPTAVERGPLPGYAVAPRGGAFRDDFSGSAVNTDRFEVLDGYAYWDSWYTVGKTSVRGGSLQLTARAGDRQGRYLRVGGVASRALYNYGVFTFRARANPMRGMVSALYLYNEDTDAAQGGTHEEIDVELSPEHPGHASLVTYHKDDWTSADLGVQNDMHRGGVMNLRTIRGLETFDSRQWNTYVVDWRPGRVIWRVNGVQAAEFTNAVPTTPMRIHLDTYHTREWSDFVDPTPRGAGALLVDVVSFVPR